MYVCIQICLLAYARRYVDTLLSLSLFCCSPSFSLHRVFCAESYRIMGSSFGIRA